MAKKDKKDNTYKEGTVLKITIGDVPRLPFLTPPENVETHIYTLPPIPYKADILFSDLPQKEQYWRRIVYPQLFYDYIPGVTQLTKEEFQLLSECLRNDIDYRINGIWFYNNGVPTYITGHHYFLLQWAPMLNSEVQEDGTSFASYRKFQRDLFYFIDLVENDNDCLGGFVCKPKKVGTTFCFSALIANSGTLQSNERSGIMSRNSIEVRDTNMAMIFHILDNLPQIMVPITGESSAMKRYFGHPRSKPTGTKQYQEKIQKQLSQRVLNSTITGRPTGVGNFDGPKYKRIIIDEFQKLWESQNISPKELFEKDSAACKLQQKIVGKVWLMAYNPERDDRGFFESKQIWLDSKKSTIKEGNILRRTKSGLYCYHISALYATEDTFNIYGDADITRAYKMNEEEREMNKEDRNKLQALIRQGARSEQESWAVGGSGSLFDNFRLQQSVAAKEKLDFMKEVYVVRGNLYWTGERMKSPVGFIPDINGRWYITRSLPSSFLNQWMVPEEGKVNIRPIGVPTMVGGGDPFSYVDSDSEGNVTGSKGASYTMGLPNLELDRYFNNIKPGDSFSKRIISFYCERPPNADDFLEDMILETLYFSKRVLWEANREWIIKKFKNEGLKEFLLFKNLETKEIEKYNPNRKQGEKSTQAGDINEGCILIDEYIKKQPSGQPDLCLLIEDVGLLTQLMSFNSQKTKPFDKVMGFIYTLIALNSFTAKSLQKQNTTEPGLIKDMWRVLSR